jgi:hypothetical protein
MKKRKKLTRSLLFPQTLSKGEAKASYQSGWTNRPTHSTFSWGGIFQWTAQQKEMYGNPPDRRCASLNSQLVRNPIMTHQVLLFYLVTWGSTFPWHLKRRDHIVTSKQRGSHQISASNLWITHKESTKQALLSVTGYHPLAIAKIVSTCSHYEYIKARHSCRSCSIKTMKSFIPPFYIEKEPSQ